MSNTLTLPEAVKDALDGLALEKYRLEKALTQGLEPNSSEVRCIHELCRTLYTVKAYSIELRQPTIQSHLAPTLVMCIPDEDDLPAILEVCNAIFTDTFLKENAKTLWKRMVHHITDLHRPSVKHYLREKGWHL